MPSFSSKQFRWADISAALFGAKVSEIREVSYNEEQEDELLYAAGDQPLDIVSGNVKYAGQLTLLKSAVDALFKIAQAQGYNSILALRFPLTVSYTNDVAINTDILLNCKISKWDDGMKQGDKFKEITLPFMFTGIKKGV